MTAAQGLPFLGIFRELPKAPARGSDPLPRAPPQGLPFLAGSIGEKAPESPARGSPSAPLGLRSPPLREYLTLPGTQAPPLLKRGGLAIFNEI